MIETTKDARKDLPPGWRWVRLDALSSIVGGDGAPQEADAFAGGTIPFVRMKDVGRYRFTLDLQKTDDKLRSEVVTKRGIRIFPPGTILMPRSGSVYTNHRARLGVHAAVVGHLAALLPNDEVFDSAFVTYTLRMVDMRQWMTKTTGLDSISLADLSNVQIPLPPLAEQRRIATVLNKQMSVVEQALAAVQAQLDGAKALLTSYLRQVFPQSGQKLPTGWRWVRLGEVCSFEGGMQPPKFMFKRDQLPGYIQLVQIQDFSRSDSAVFIPKSKANRTFDETDVMIGRYGPPVFQILRGLSGAYNVALMKTVPQECLSKDYLFHLLKEPRIQERVVSESQRSAGQSGVQKEFLENIEVALPPLSEQRNIAAELNDRLAVAVNLRKALEEQLNEINALPAVLIRQALNGEL
jgi:type I restriction enzyme S subunit